MNSEARVNVNLNNCCKLLQGRYCKVNSQVVNATNKIDVNMQNDHFRQGMQRKRWFEKLSIGNDKVMELKSIKHDEAL